MISLNPDGQTVNSVNVRRISMPTKICKICGKLKPKKAFERVRCGREWRFRNECERCRQRGEGPRMPTPADWKNCRAYWQGHCAVCGRQPDKQYAIVPDHWIPFSKGGNSAPTNILPLCHARRHGQGCNNRKQAKAPQEWLLSELGSQDAVEKLAEINQYFNWVKDDQQ